MGPRPETRVTGKGRATFDDMMNSAGYGHILENDAEYRKQRELKWVEFVRLNHGIRIWIDV